MILFDPVLILRDPEPGSTPMGPRRRRFAMWCVCLLPKARGQVLHRPSRWLLPAAGFRITGSNDPNLILVILILIGSQAQ